MLLVDVVQATSASTSPIAARRCITTPQPTRCCRERWLERDIRRRDPAASLADDEACAGRVALALDPQLSVHGRFRRGCAGSGRGAAGGSRLLPQHGERAQSTLRRLGGVRARLEPGGRRGGRGRPPAPPPVDQPDARNREERRRDRLVEPGDRPLGHASGSSAPSTAISSLAANTCARSSGPAPRPWSPAASAAASAAHSGRSRRRAPPPGRPYPGQEPPPPSRRPGEREAAEKTAEAAADGARVS